MDPVVVRVETKQDAESERKTRLDEISKELLSTRPDLTTKMKDQGWNLLHCASFAGREDLVTQILSVAPDLADEVAVTDYGSIITALDLALYDGHERVALRVLEVCPKVNSFKGFTVLHLAAAKGFRTVVERLLATNPTLINALTHNDDTALHLAAFNGDIAVFAIILAANPALLDATTSDGCTVLHVAASAGHVALVELLLTKSATLINATTHDGWTAMHYAAGKGHLSVVKFLRTASPALIHGVTNDGRNAVHFAISEGHPDVALYLLTEAPVLINAATNDGETPLQSAVLAGLAEVVAHILGVDATLANATNPQGLTQLHEAAFCGHLAVAEQLLAASPALIDGVMDHGLTVLHSAALGGHAAMVSYFLRLKPALIGMLTREGITTLHCAGSGWNSQSETAQPKLTAELLLAMKPELISLKDDYGNTPLHCMAEMCQSRELLEQMWRLYPEALHAANTQNNDTPFHRAVAESNDCAIELFQWVLTWEEIESAYAQCEKSYVERFKPVLETQCEGLFVVLLPDVAETVFEYLGFERGKHKKGESLLVEPTAIQPLK